MQLETHDGYDEVCKRAAELLLTALEDDPTLVLGLPTGRTPLGMYRRVVGACHVRPRCFAGAVTFNLDEYAGLPADHPASYRAYMERNLVRHTDLRPENVHVPDGTATTVRREHPGLDEAEALAKECERYEAAIHRAGGLGVTFLGLGRNGHIAFNEPGSPFGSRTRVVDLAPSTRAANAADFPTPNDVPHQALTVGIATILESRRIVLLASGANKRPAVDRFRTGDVTETFPASALHLHRDVTVLLDREAAGEAAA